MANQYSTQVEWSAEDGGYIATCPELAGVSAFGDTRAEAIQELETVIRLTLDTYANQGWPIPEPRAAVSYSGQLRLRLPKSLHRALSERAVHEGVSLNTLIASFLAEAVGQGRGICSAVEDVSAVVTRLMEAVAAVEPLSIQQSDTDQTNVGISNNTFVQDPLLLQLGVRSY